VSVEATTPRRQRFATKELVKLVKAVEMADDERVDLGMRLLDTEDRLELAREDARRWRQCYEAVVELGASPESLDKLMREWVGKA
jgi:hypothetical protein